MFGSQVVDVAIGMVFVYLLLSLVCSAANELIETILKNRAKQLEKGIRSRLNNVGLAQKIYDHALVSGLYASDRTKPSYIPARRFALAPLNTIAPDATCSVLVRSAEQVHRYPFDGETEGKESGGTVEGLMEAWRPPDNNRARNCSLSVGNSCNP